MRLINCGNYIVNFSSFTTRVTVSASYRGAPIHEI